MKTFKFFMLLFSTLCFQLFAQSVFIGFGTGLNFINGNNYYTADLGRIGIYENINGTQTNFTGLKLSNELQYQIQAKYSHNILPVSFNLGLNYFRMRGNESIPIYNNVLAADLIKDVTSKMDIWSAQLGANYSFNISPIKPFISASLLANYFDDVYFEIADGEYTSQFSSYKNGMRYGYSLGAGIDYSVFPNVDISLSTNYNSLNVLQKRDGEALLSSVSVLFNIYYKII